MSATPDSPPDFEFDDEFEPDFLHDFDPDHEVEFIHEEQHVEAPVFPYDQHLDVPADHEPAPADPEPEIAPELVLAHDPLPVHDTIPIDVPVVAPPVVDVLVVAPLPDPILVLIDRARFATHVVPRYAHTLTPPFAPIQTPIDVTQFHLHVSDVHRMDLPVTFLQDIPPPHPGEGPSSQQHDHIPPVSATFPFMPPFAPTAHTAFSFAPTGEPFMWSSPNVMPLSDP
ncbi:hypothetical protein Hanom_Chr15g01397411 [Helianthus anomalus]